MNIMDWVPPLTTAGLFAVALWLGRKLILTRLTKSVAHEFDIKLEALRSHFRESEERLKFDLSTKEAQIAALRSGALTALANRQGFVDKRRVEAVDQIWAAVTALTPARTVSQFMAYIKFEQAAEQWNTPEGREFVKYFGFGFDFKNVDLSSAAKARPFVMPMVWAHYSALVAVCTHAVLRWELLKSGLGSKANYINDDAVNNLIKVALPHQTSYVEQFGPAGYHWLLDELERCLLREFNVMLSGADTDMASVEQATKIVAAANSVIEQGSVSKVTV